MKRQKRKIVEPAVVFFLVLIGTSALAQVPEIGSQIGLPNDPKQID